MLFGRRSILALVLVAFCAASPNASAAATKARSAAAAPAYKAAIVVDAATGNVLFEDNADLVSPPASMTKLMTFLVVHDKIAMGSLTLDTPVIVTAADSRIGGTQVWLKEGEEFTVDELLHAMMIQSANDAAHALARTTAGSPSAFVELMNVRAAQLGMSHTTFRTPHGLPPSNRKLAEGDLTTARDFALLCRELLLKTDVTRYTSIKTREFGGPQRVTPVVMNNHHHLLGRVAGIDGLKTGFTNGAGFCLSATAERNGRRVIVVVMGSTESKTRDMKVMELLERGFTLLPPNGPAFVRGAAAPNAAPVADSSPISRAPITAEEKRAQAQDDSPPVIKFTPPPKKK